MGSQNSKVNSYPNIIDNQMPPFFTWDPLQSPIMNLTSSNPELWNENMGSVDISSTLNYEQPFKVADERVVDDITEIKY